MSTETNQFDHTDWHPYSYHSMVLDERKASTVLTQTMETQQELSKIQ